MRVKAQFRAEAIRAKAEEKASRTLAKAENRALKIEASPLRKRERKIRLDVHGCPSAICAAGFMRWPLLSLAAGIVLICGTRGQSEMGMRRIHGIIAGAVHQFTATIWVIGAPRHRCAAPSTMNIFLLIAGTYTPVSFRAEPFWRNIIIISMWACTVIAIIIHVIWIKAPRWLYTAVYIIFGMAVWPIW